MAKGHAPAGGDEAAVPTPAGGWVVHTPAGDMGPSAKNAAVLAAVVYTIKSGASPEDVRGVVGAGAFRSVPGYYEGKDLWTEFAAEHGRSEKHRRLWFLDHPIYGEDRTWLLANNVWGTHAVTVLSKLCELSRGMVSVTTPTGEVLGPPSNQ